MYDDVADIIDTVIERYDNTDLATAQNLTARRARILHYVQRSAEDLWYQRPWPFTMASTSLALSGGAANLPADFAQVSYEGFVVGSANLPWVEVTLQDMLYMRQRGFNTSRRFYAIDGLQLLVPDTGSTETLLFVYQKAMPTLTDGDMGGSDPTNFPLPFGEALLLGAVVKLKSEEGDPRADWKIDHARAVSRVLALWGRQSRSQRMPNAVGGAY